MFAANRSDNVEGFVAVAIAYSDPAFEFTSVMAAVEPKTYRGHAGIRRYISDLADAWEEWRMDAEEVVEVFADTVLATIRTHLLGKGSGATVEATRGVVFVFSEGKIARGHVYLNRDDALEAVELRE